MLTTMSAFNTGAGKLSFHSEWIYPAEFSARKDGIAIVHLCDGLRDRRGGGFQVAQAQTHTF